ncbi:hypothetical protein [uncultured Algimonas sp.]|uniref:glycosyltransferase family 4 protein n=1 Tax=uncultured Algimonas sp. TaxID=1547920 RepID=UPI002616E830|nr:hypothetical protein [uncultured Algimonas sp.]
MPMMSMDMLIGLQVAGMALFVSLAVTGFARLGGLGDIPDHRSSHSRMTPTAGGLGIMAGVGSAILIAAVFHQDRIFAQPGTAEKLASFLSVTFAVSFLGLVDDRYILRARFKFGLILALSALGVGTIGSVTMLPFRTDHLYLLWWSGLGGTILWLFTVTNAVNFVDGINGLFASSLGIASAGLCALALSVGAPVTALMTGSLAGALFGFLPYNFRPRAAVFAGDCGALGAAFLYAGSVLFLVHEQPELRLLYAGPLLIMPLLADVLITLLRKPFKRIGFLAPHRSHLYQRWARKRGGHIGVSIIYALLSLLMVALVHQAHMRGTLGSMSGLGLVAGLFVAAYLARAATLPN